jgi:hypothetical protein
MQKKLMIELLGKTVLILTTILISGCSNMPKDPCAWDDVIHITKNDEAVMSDKAATAIDKHNTDFEKNCKPQSSF